MNWDYFIKIGLFCLLPVVTFGNNVRITQADLQHLTGQTGQTGQTLRLSVTLKHDDSGWEHYADLWQVVSESGQVLGTRTLLHPHVEEQPFTRDLTVDMTKVKDDRLHIKP